MNSIEQGTHIFFYFQERSKSGKTSIWHVYSKDGQLVLGHIKWFGRWRKYAFYPAVQTIYEEVCLNEIAEFIKNKTREHRGAREKGAEIS
jgi:hypothetical protein